MGQWAVCVYERLVEVLEDLDLDLDLGLGREQGRNRGLEETSEGKVCEND